MSNLYKTQEQIDQIEKQLKELKVNVAAAKKLKGAERLDRSDKIKSRDIRRIHNYINSLECSVSFNEQEMNQDDIKQQKQKIEEFKKRLQKQQKALQYARNEGLKQQTIFEERKDTVQKIGTERQQLIKQADKAQIQSQEGVKRALRMLYEMKEIGYTVNVELERQIQQLDAVYDELQDTEGTMKRAMRHINYFARSVYTDKILMALAFLVLLAVIAIIVLSAIGKIPGAPTDTLN